MQKYILVWQFAAAAAAAARSTESPDVFSVKDGAQLSLGAQTLALSAPVQ